jgi:RNA polymerase sigma-70 factor (ECF subfamily)
MSGGPLLEAARRGDENAFRELVDPLRRPLYAHCYRMLGCAHDAEDATQDALLRAWRSLPTFTGPAPFRSWLYRIATNVCLTALEKRPRRALPVDFEPSADPRDQPPGELQHDSNPIEADHEQQETAALALTVALHHLSTNQRAALILRDVLGLPAREAASTLGTTAASVNSALQRARARVDCIGESGPPELPRAIGDEQLQAAVDGFVGALARGDVDTLIGIAADTALTAERSWTYSPVPAY